MSLNSVNQPWQNMQDQPDPLDELFPAEQPQEMVDEQPVQVAGNLPREVLSAIVKQARIKPPSAPVVKNMKKVADPDSGLADAILQRMNQGRDPDNLLQKYAGNINLDRLEGPEDLNDLVIAVADVLKKDVDVARRGKISDAQRFVLAQELGMTEQELLSRATGVAWNAEHIEAARLIYVNQRFKTAQLSDKVRMGTATDEEKVMFRREMSKYTGMQLQMHGLAAEAARSFNAFKKVALHGELSAAETQQLLAEGGGDAVTLKLAEAFSSFASDPRKAGKFARNAWKANSIDMVREYWTNTLLSSLATQAVNMTSTGLFDLWMIGERAVAGLHEGPVYSGESVQMLMASWEGVIDGMRAFAHTLRNEGPVIGSSQPVFAKSKRTREVIGGKSSEKMEASQGDQYFRKSITGEQFNYKLQSAGRMLGMQHPEKLDLAKVRVPFLESLNIKNGVDLLGQMARISGRFLTAEDEFMKSVAYRQQLRALAYRKAKDEIRSGADLGGESAGQYLKRRRNELVEALGDMRMDTEGVAQVTRQLGDPDIAEIYAKSMQFADEVTFTEALTPAGQSLSQFVERSKVGFLLVPFKKVAWNLGRQTFRRMPGINFVTKGFHEARERGGAEWQLEKAKLELGSLLAGATALLVASNDDCNNPDATLCITGARPAEAPERATKYRQGWQEYSLRIGDEFHTFNRLDPLGWHIGMVADFTRLAGMAHDYAESGGNLTNGQIEDKLADLAAAISLSMSQNVMSKTFMSGITDFAEVTTSYDKEAMLKYMKRFAASFVPYSSLQRNINRWNDPYQRQAVTLRDELCKVMVGCSESLPPRVDLWGRKVENAQGLFSYSKANSPEPIDRELDRLHYHPGKPRASLFSVELTPREHAEWMIHRGGFQAERGASFEDFDLSGLTMLQALNRMVTKSKAYREGSDWTEPEGVKVHMIDGIIDYYSGAALGPFLDSHPRLHKAREAMLQAREMALDNGASKADMKKLLQLTEPPAE